MFEMLAAAGGAAVISGLLGANASKKAAQIQGDSTRYAADVHRETYETTRRDLAPYRDAGKTALQRLMYLTGLDAGEGSGTTGAGDGELLFADNTGAPRVNEQRYASDPVYRAAWDKATKMHRAQYGQDFTDASDTGVIERSLTQFMAEERSRLGIEDPAAVAGRDAKADPEFGSLMRDFTLADFQKDPGYQFRVDEGERALTRGAAARGLAKSTPGLKALLRFNQDMGSQEYGAAYGRFEAGKSQKFNLLSYLSGAGQNAAAMAGTAGTNAAAGMSQASIAGGNAAAGGVVGSASAWNNAIQGGLGNYMYQQRYDEMMKRFPVFGSGTPGMTPGQLNAITPS